MVMDKARGKSMVSFREQSPEIVFDADVLHVTLGAPACLIRPGILSTPL